MNISELSPSQLRQAADLKERMAKLQKELDSILGTPTTSVTAPDGPKKKRMVSAATRAKMAAAQQKRWAVKGAKTAKAVIAPKPASKTVPAATPAPKKKWKLSAAGLARIKAANKAYWAAKKAAKKK
jgi:hypothetical protein